MLQFRFAADSVTGPVREHNEDAGFAGPYLLCVADGVGGAAAGEVAAATTTYVVSARALASPGLDPATVLRRGAAEAHEQLRVGVAADPRRTGMASTLTAVLTDGRAVVLAQVGDSRAYRLRDGGLDRLSHDQTYVQALLDEGRISADDAARSPFRHVITGSIEARRAPRPATTRVELRAGDRLLLCSDGLSDVVTDDEIARLAAGPSRRRAVAALVDAAIRSGTRDNVTVVLADVVDAPAVVGDGLLLGAGRDLGLVVDPAAVRGARTA